MAITNLLDYLTEKLEGASNFVNWKYEMECILTIYDFWGIVEGKVTPPTDVKAKATYTKNANIALSLIKLSIGIAYRELVRATTNPKEAWDSIMRIFDRKDEQKILLLKQKLYNLHMKGSVTDYLMEVKSLRNDFFTAGHCIEDKELIPILLNGLPNKFHPYVSMLQLMGRATTSSLEEIEVLLLQHEVALLKDQKEMNDYVIVDKKEMNNFVAAYSAQVQASNLKYRPPHLRSHQGGRPHVPHHQFQWHHKHPNHQRERLTSPHVSSKNYGCSFCQQEITTPAVISKSTPASSTWVSKTVEAKKAQAFHHQSTIGSQDLVIPSFRKKQQQRHKMTKVHHRHKRQPHQHHRLPRQHHHQQHYQQEHYHSYQHLHQPHQRSTQHYGALFSHSDVYAYGHNAKFRDQVPLHCHVSQH